MKSKIFKLINIILLGMASMFFFGCHKETEEERLQKIQFLINKDIKKANEHLDANQSIEALQLLEKLHEKFPEHAEILEAIATVYDQMGDSALASFYLEQSYLIDPEQLDFALFAAKSYDKAENWDASIRNFRVYLEKAPEDAAAWKMLARTFQRSGHPNLALDAYLRGVEMSPTQPDAQESAIIGNMALDVSNYTRAKHWFNKALIEELQNPEALLGLLKIALEHKAYTQVESLVDQLESLKLKDFGYKTINIANNELDAWYKKQKQIEQDRLEQERRRLEEIAREKAIQEQLEAAEIERKALEAAAVDAVNKKLKESSEGGGESISEHAPTEEPEIAEPELPEPKTATDYYNLAEDSCDSGDFPGAIQNYWKSLTLDSDRVPIWHCLSEAYYESNLFSDAEMTIQEAIRRSPKDSSHTLFYLKIIQHSRAPAYFMQEVLKARKKFPGLPEITLAAAHGYEDVSQNYRNALRLYELYLEQAPVSTQREEVEETIKELRRKLSSDASR